jgi:hypothetical protein
MVAEHLQSSSALSFARSLFFAAEGKALFDQGFVFASAVATYYSLFHLGGSLILALCSRPASSGDPLPGLRRKLEGKWGRRRPRTLAGGRSYLPDPAESIDHSDVPLFLEGELPEAAGLIGSRNMRGTLRDMRDFVSYAPRMEATGHENVLYSGCQYEASQFQALLRQHLSRMEKIICSAVPWLRQDYRDIYARILSGDFVLFEFAELSAYHPKSVSRTAFRIYSSICDREQINWRIWRPDPGVFHADEAGQPERYAVIISSF